MPHTVDQSLSVKGLPVQNLLQISAHLLFVPSVRNVFLQIAHHLHHLDVGPAVLGPLQGGQRRRDNRIGIRPRGSNHTGGKGGIVSAAMLHMKHKGNIQHLCLQLRIFLVRPQHHQQIFRCRQLLRRTMYVHALIILIVIVSVITVHGQHGKYADQPDALPEYVLDTGIAAVLIIRSQGQHTPGQGIHDIAAGGLHDDIPGEIGGQRPVGGKDLPELLQLLLGGQFPEQEQICHLLKTGVLAPKTLHQFNAVIPPIPELSFAGCLFSVHHLKGINPGNVGQSCHHTVSVLVSEPSLHLISVKHLRLKPVSLFA